MTERLTQILQRLSDPATADDAAVTAMIVALDEGELISLANDPTALDGVAKPVRLVGDHLNGRFAEKGPIVRLMLACMVAQVPMVLLGPPGTAKSELVRTLCDVMGMRTKREGIRDYEDKLRDDLLKASDATATATEKGDLAKGLRVQERPLFEYLVTRYTTPEEILGPVNIDALLTFSLFYRESIGMLPMTQVAFLDEIFKANSAILNSLLSIINERIYYNAGRAFDIDLMMVFGASNESPDTVELGALYDRFPIRAVSEPVHVTRPLLQRSMALAYERNVRRGGGGNGSPGGNGAPGGGECAPIASLNHFRLLSRVNFVRYGGHSMFDRPESPHGFDFAREFDGVFRELRDQFGISDRTPERLLRVAKALALLDRDGPAPELTPEHLVVFKYVAPTAEASFALSHIVDEIIARC